jgi:hypothetical protein
MQSWTHAPMAEPTQGVLDTSVLIDHDLIDPALLPDESAITAITPAELAAGPHATENREERAGHSHSIIAGIVQVRGDLQTPSRRGRPCRARAHTKKARESPPGPRLSGGKVLRPFWCYRNRNTGT